jgi:hypothetical protein
MTEEKEEGLIQEEKTSTKEKESITVDLKELYKFEPKDITPDISIVRYSNLAYIQITHRDVYIDFLEMPGIKKDGKVFLNGTRIYMSFVAAQKLADTLQGILEQVDSRGEMEKFLSKKEKEDKTS